jgi:hypothetical protein
MSLFDDASLVLIPDGAKDSKLYSIKPTDGSGDFTFSRSTTATRVNESGLIESVATNVPRIDYSEGGCPSLLLEPQRTNLATYSEDFSNSDWLKVGVGSGVAPIVTADQGIAPDGTMSADRIQFDVSASSGDRSILRQSFSALSTTGKITFYAKSNTGSNQYVLYHDGGSEGEATITTEWQRFEFESNPAGSIYLGIELINGTSTENTADILLWGFQVEDVDSYPTSYIPTNSAAVTRSQDYGDNAGDASVFNDTEGVLYLESSWLSNELGTSTIAISDGTASNRIILGYIGVRDDLYCTSIGGGSSPSLMSYDVGDITTNHKIAIKYKANDFAFWVDGVERGTQSSGTTPVGLNELSFSSGADGSKIFGNMKQILYFPTALTDAELAALTTI